MRISKATRRGTALLAVLWLSAALATIAIALADTVRGEAERSATAMDGLRAQKLAEGGLRRGILYFYWSRIRPDLPQYRPPGSFYHFNFPEGTADVQIVPETARFNINTISPDDLLKVLANLGVAGDRAQQIAAGILDWRSATAEVPTAFDSFYLSLHPPYVAPHAPFQDIEELLSVRGVTPDLFYGAWQPVRHEGLRDCLSVFGSGGPFDVNTATPAVLATAGVPPEGITALLQRRKVQPFVTADDLGAFAEIAGAGFPRLRIGGVSMFTLKSTARPRLANGQLSDMSRTVAALIKLQEKGSTAPYDILRWYDAAEPPLP